MPLRTAAEAADQHSWLHHHHQPQAPSPPQVRRGPPPPPAGLVALRQRQGQERWGLACVCVEGGPGGALACPPPGVISPSSCRPLAGQPTQMRESGASAAAVAAAHSFEHNPTEQSEAAGRRRCRNPKLLMCKKVQGGDYLACTNWVAPGLGRKVQGGRRTPSREQRVQNPGAHGVQNPGAHKVRFRGCSLGVQPDMTASTTQAVATEYCLPYGHCVRPSRAKAAATHLTLGPMAKP